jgi:predicted small secreted protein
MFKIRYAALSLLLAAVTGSALGMPQSNEGAGQDIKDAGHSVKEAAKDTGSATKKTAKKTGHAIKKTSKKVTHKAAHETRKGAGAVENKTAPE